MLADVVESTQIPASGADISPHASPHMSVAYPQVSSTSVACFPALQTHWGSTATIAAILPDSDSRSVFSKRVALRGRAALIRRNASFRAPALEDYSERLVLLNGLSPHEKRTTDIIKHDNVLSQGRVYEGRAEVVIKNSFLHLSPPSRR